MFFPSTKSAPALAILPGMCQKGEAMLYTVRVEMGGGRPPKFYVGSSENVMSRLEQHEAMQGAACLREWCKGGESLSSTTCCIACKGDGGERDILEAEAREARILAVLYGADRVRGGDLVDWSDTKTLKRGICHLANLCQKCGLPGHYAGACTTASGYAASWYALFGDAQLMPVPWELERDFYARLEPELCRESDFARKVCFDHWLGYRMQILLTERYREKQYGDYQFRRRLCFVETPKALDADGERDFAAKLQATLKAAAREWGTRSFGNAVRDHHKAEALANPYTLVHSPQYGGRTCTTIGFGIHLLRESDSGAATTTYFNLDSAQVTVSLPDEMPTAAQRMHQAAFLRAYRHHLSALKRKHEIQVSDFRRIKLCRGHSPLEPLGPPAESWGSKSEIPPPPYSRLFAFVMGGTNMRVPGEILAAVPGSKLDQLAREKPGEVHTIPSRHKCIPPTTSTSHATVHLSYDRDAFKYLIDRINQLRCHPVVESEDEIPVVTEVSLPANLDHTSIKVLAGALGVECIL